MISLLWLWLRIGGGNLEDKINTLVVQRVDESNSFCLRIDPFMNLAASVPKLIWDPELHEHVLTHDEDLEESVEKVEWQGAYQEDETDNFELGLSFHDVKLLVPHHVHVRHVLFRIRGVGVLLVDEFGDSEGKKEYQWSIVQEVGIAHGPDTNVHEVLAVVV